MEAANLLLDKELARVSTFVESKVSPFNAFEVQQVRFLNSLLSKSAKMLEIMKKLLVLWKVLKNLEFNEKVLTWSHCKVSKKKFQFPS